MNREGLKVCFIFVMKKIHCNVCKPISKFEPCLWFELLSSLSVKASIFWNVTPSTILTCLVTPMDNFVQWCLIFLLNFYKLFPSHITLCVNLPAGRSSQKSCVWVYFNDTLQGRRTTALQAVTSPKGFRSHDCTHITYP